MSIGGTSHRRSVRYGYLPSGDLDLVETTISHGAASAAIAEQYRYEQTTGGPHAVTSIERTVAGMTLETGYSYDERGRQRTAGGRTVDYTNFDLPRRIDEAGVSVSYEYDAFARRARSIESSGRVVDVGGGEFERRQSLSGATEWVFYVHGPLGIVAQVSETQPGVRDTRYLHTDHLGSVAVISTRNGIEQAVWTDPFGVLLAADLSDAPRSSGGVTVGFGGHREERSIDLVDMGGRFFDPRLRRFLTPDPIDRRSGATQSWNFYSYVENRPLSAVDPTGLSCRTVRPDGHPDGGLDFCGGTSAPREPVREPAGSSYEPRWERGREPGTGSWGWGNREGLQRMPDTWAPRSSAERGRGTSTSAQPAAAPAARSDAPVLLTQASGAGARRGDLIIPLTFPEYEIDVEGRRLPGLGHAGVLVIDRETRRARYFEYGRYNGAGGPGDPPGRTRERTGLPRVRFGADGAVTVESLRAVLRSVSRQAGHGGAIAGAMFETTDHGFEDAVSAARERMDQNRDPSRAPYDLWRNNCYTFAEQIARAGGAPRARAPSQTGMQVQTPITWIGRYQRTAGAQPVTYSAQRGVTVEPRPRGLWW